jgi:hypothetical protein
MDVAGKVVADIPELVKAPRALEVAADDQALVLERGQGMRAVGQAQLGGFLAETEAMVNLDDTSSTL